MSVNVFIQARMSSSRLPGKVLMEVMGEPLLAYLVDRVSKAASVDKVVVLTSLHSSDDAIDAFCKARGVSCFRGTLEDVLGRFWCAFQQFPASHIVRITADCPLSDPEIIDELVDLHIREENDYSCNFLNRGVPDGLDVEVMSARALEMAAKNADKHSEREHVTPFLREPEQNFRCGNSDFIKGQGHQRWTIDYPEDFELVTKIIENLHPNNAQFGYREVLALMEKKPELVSINQGFVHNEGLLKSIQEDRKVIVSDNGSVPELS